MKIVYARYDKYERLELWDSIFAIENRVSIPWLLLGDFHTILNASDKIGQVSVIAADVEDFRDCIKSCELTQIIHKGSPFT